MFFYLSFLRPLPSSSDTVNHILITPQIANDLRTAHLEEVVDIFYSWSLTLPGCASTGAGSAGRKLTTWRSSSMYKNIPVPLPPTAGVGQEWRLSLSCTTPGTNFVIDLSSKDFGARPFPVFSMPVRLGSRKEISKTAAKQEQIERLYSVPTPRDTRKQSIILCIREQTSFELDKKVWDSGLGLSSWLVNLVLQTESPSNSLVEQLRSTLNSSGSDPLRILELGTGTGIVSVCLSALLEGVRESRPTDIFATDLPSAIELIEHNLSTNKTAYPSVNLQSLVLDWDDKALPPQVLGKLDVIVMADVTYNTASFPAIVGTLERLILSSRSLGGQAPHVLLAYKQRDPAERTLWTMLHEIDIDMDLVDKVTGAGAEKVEIWLWKEVERHLVDTAS